MKYPLFDQSARDPDSTWSGTARLYNLYRERSGDEVVLRSVLGMQRFGAMSGTFCRAMAEVRGVLYIAQGGALYSIASNGVETLLANIDDHANTTISGNNGDVTVCVDGKYYVWDGTSLTQPAGAAFSAFGSVEFINQLTVLTEKDGRRVQWTGLADASSFNGLDFATAENEDDNVIRAVKVGSVLWVLKEKTIEFWDGTRTGGLAALGGRTQETGLKSFGLVCKYPGGVFFVGDDNVAYKGSGTAFQSVANPAVVSSIEKQDPEACFYYEDEGHKFCVITFKSRPAWCYDIVTEEWHERGEGITGRWTAEAAAICYGKSFIGTDHGTIYELARVGQDMGGPLIRQATGRTVGNGKRTRVAMMELPCTVGTIQLSNVHRPSETLLSDDDPGDGSVVASDGVAIVVLPVDTGSEEQVELELSRDKGHTWGDPLPRGLGALGEYERQVRWRSLGSFQYMTARVTYSGPSDVSLGSWMEVDAA